MSGQRRRLGLAVAGLAVVGLLASTVMLVDSDEVAVVFRFGAVARTATSGLAFRLPSPLERDVRVPVTEVRRAEPGRQVLLSGDTNLVEVDVVAQYTISDPVAFLISTQDPEALVADVVSGRLAAQVSGMEVDTLLTTGRSTLEREVLESAQASLDSLGAGVRLDAVELRALEPPGAVVAAFNDVSSARGDRDTMVLSAQSYASRQGPDVRGQAAQLKEQARTAAANQISQAKADISHFRALQAAWSRTPESVRRTLREETAQAVSPQVRLVPSGTAVVLP